MVDDDGYWAEVAKRTGSNSAAEGFALLKSFIESGTASDSALSGMAAVLRSLSQSCRDQIAVRREAAKNSVPYIPDQRDVEHRLKLFPWTASIHKR